MFVKNKEIWQYSTLLTAMYLLPLKLITPPSSSFKACFLDIEIQAGFREKSMLYFWVILLCPVTQEV